MYDQNHPIAYDLENLTFFSPTNTLLTQQTQNEQLHQNDNQYQIIGNHKFEILVDEQNILDQHIEPDQQNENQDSLIEEIIPIELIKSQAPLDQYLFTQKVILINVIQHLLTIAGIFIMIFTDFFQNFFSKFTKFLYQFYIIIAIIIVLLMVIIFKKPPKNKQLKTGVQIITKVLYIIFLVGITNLIPEGDGIFYALFLLDLIYSYSIVSATQAGDKILILIAGYIEFYFVICLLICSIDFLIYPTEDYISIILCCTGIFVINGSIVTGYALIFSYSLNQLIHGKFKLRKDDYLDASTLVILNIFTPTCFQEA